jgi:hypothetical protein
MTATGSSKLFGINPTEFELVKAVSKQLEDLEAYGMIEATSKGWKWIR